MGEIGIPRREFLYDIQFWEVRRIIRGYRRRGRLRNQLIAECAYATIYAMRDPKGMTAAQTFPEVFEDDEEDENAPARSDEDRDDMLALIEAVNAKRSGKPT